MIFQHKQFYFLALILSFSFYSHAVLAVETHNRVEELFIWKVSDELKLSVPEEKAFTDLMKSLSQKKAQVTDNLQSTLKKMSESQATKDKEMLLVTQKKLLKAYNELSLEEVEKIQKLFGVDRAAQYFVLKNDLTNRLKTMLASPDKAQAAAKPLAPPQVIEEK